MASAAFSVSFCRSTFVCDYSCGDEVLYRSEKLKYKLNSSIFIVRETKKINKSFRISSKLSPSPMRSGEVSYITDGMGHKTEILDLIL
jgi:hypothetical protein